MKKIFFAIVVLSLYSACVQSEPYTNAGHNFSASHDGKCIDGQVQKTDSENPPGKGFKLFKVTG